MRALLATLLALGLAACAGAPKREQGPPADKPQGQAQAPARKVSPYAPAQEDPSKRGDYTAGGLYRPGERDSVPSDIPDVDAIPEPAVTNEPRSKVGNRRNYSVLGHQYQVLDDTHGFVETGTASYYGNKFHGRRTSNLEVYDMYAFTAAHKTLPLPSFARVTNLDNGKSVIVRVNDRGPFHPGRVIDLSYAAAVKLGYDRKGTARVEVRALQPGEAPPAVAVVSPPAPTAAPVKDTAMDRLVAAIPTALASAGDAPIGRAVADDYRFDMRQDGRVMSADEFDAWMKSRRVRVATGRPGTPEASAPSASSTTPTFVPSSPALPADTAAPAEVAALASPMPAQGAVASGDAITLQVAAFSARANADRALAMLQGAGIGQARLHDSDTRGQKVWRLRVGPLPAAQASELAVRIQGLGFGPPQRVRE